MRIWLLPLVAGIAHAAVIRGTVVENQTGRPLSRATVQIEPVAGSGGVRQTGHTDLTGQFVFQTPPGTYILFAIRRPFLTAFYGQKRWNSAGMPLVVTEAETAYASIRMMRYAAITGTVVDENDVGKPQFMVAAYRNTRPLQLAADGKADECGVFRIDGLLPGDYLVRSLGGELQGIGFKGTFAHEAPEAEQGRVVNVQIEEDARAIDVRPLPGQTFRLSVRATALDPREVPITLTLVSEFGRQTVEGASELSHVFSGLAPGSYEIFAQAPSLTRGSTQSSYQRLTISKDVAMEMPLYRTPQILFQFDGLPLSAETDGTVRVLGRRKDLSGPHDVQVLPLENHRATLAAGPWELALAPIDGYYVSGFNAPGPPRPNPRPEGWNEVTINGGSVRFSLSGSPGAVRGAVTDAGGPVVGAPVFLEPMDLEPAKRITDTYVTRTDVQGRYRFTGLAPGRYRVLSSFEYQMPDSNTMAISGAKELQVDPHSEIAQDLELYVIR